MSPAKEDLTTNIQYQNTLKFYKLENQRLKTDTLTDLHLVRLFWNQVLTCASVIFRFLARLARSVEARYFCLWNRFSSSQIWMRENEVRGFFRFGGVRFWYGWPIRRPARLKGPGKNKVRTCVKNIRF